MFLDSDFLDNWDLVERTLIFDDTWVMANQWLQVTARAPSAAWSYGDISCESLSLPLFLTFQLIRDFELSHHLHPRPDQSRTRPLQARRALLLRHLGQLVLDVRLYAVQEGREGARGAEQCDAVLAAECESGGAARAGGICRACALRRAGCLTFNSRIDYFFQLQVRLDRQVNDEVQVRWVGRYIHTSWFQSNSVRLGIPPRQLRHAQVLPRADRAREEPVYCVE